MLSCCMRIMANLRTGRFSDVNPRWFKYCWCGIAATIRQGNNKLIYSVLGLKNSQVADQGLISGLAWKAKYSLTRISPNIISDILL